MVSGQQVGYVCVIGTMQNTQGRLNGVELDALFEDRVSGKGSSRPQLIACLSRLGDGDTLHVHSMDQLAGSLGELRRTVRKLTECGVVVKFHKEGLSFQVDDSPLSNLLLSMLDAVAVFEQSSIQELPSEDIELANKIGGSRGRRSVITADQAEAIRKRAADGESKTDLAREFGCSRETIYFHLRRR